MPSELGHSRVGVIVGKKTARRAVQRNYMKRCIREWFRLMRPDLGSIDILVRPQKPFLTADAGVVYAEFRELMHKISMRTQGRRS